jgi:hypothetical protein
VLDGLEVKIAFGSVWKESLGELSGGQRQVFIIHDSFMELYINRILFCHLARTKTDITPGKLE